MSGKYNGYFEKQHDRDCTIHSFNNALGYNALTKAQVLENIQKHVDAFIKQNELPPNSPEVKKFRNMYSEGDSFFTAEIVWDTAIKLGVIRGMIPIPGFGGSFTNVESLPSWVRESNIIILGVNKKGFPHAIAAREGYLFDSDKCCEPITFNTKNLRTIFKKVLTAFVIKRNDMALFPLIIRTQPLSLQQHPQRVGVVTRHIT